MSIGLRGVLPKQKKVVRFTANGTWTVPANVDYIIVTACGGGGGTGNVSGAGGTPGTDGSNTTVAAGFATVTGLGGRVNNQSDNALGARFHDALANTGRPGFKNGGSGGDAQTYSNGGAGEATEMTQAGFVSGGATVTVTLGAGGSGGGTNDAAGGSGYAFIEYYE